MVLTLNLSISDWVASLNDTQSNVELSFAKPKLLRWESRRNVW